jgi:tetratricopeptide (TPR) repeat protein
MICALLVGCGLQRDAIQESRSYFDQGNYYQAFLILEESRNPDQPDDELEREYWRARLFYLLDLGQELVFENREAEAIEELQKALALDPDNEVALEWIAKSRSKLADRARVAGDAERVQGHLDLALGYYQEALRHVSDHTLGLAGLRLVEEAYEQKERRAKDEHMQGVRAMFDRRYNEVLHHETIALEHDPSHDDARALHARVIAVIADEQYDRARRVEEDRKYGAALMEYLMVQELVPDYPGLEQQIEHMKNEVAAEALIRKAEMVIRRAQYQAEEVVRREMFAEASKLLNEAFQTSISDQATISELMVIAREKEYETHYYAAKDLELQSKFEDAVEAYKVIDGEWPDGFMDVKARVTDLEEAIAQAEQAYATGQEAERQGDIEAALEAYRYALLFYPRYRDLEEKIKALSVDG